MTCSAAPPQTLFRPFTRRGNPMSVDILDRVYDAYTGEMGQHFMRETQRRIHWICAAVLGEAVLDIGCSQGIVPILLGREGKTVLGIDTSAAAIHSAEQHLVSEAVSVRKRVSFVEADAVSHDFGTSRFDTVVLGEVLEHLVHPERLLEVAARMLAPGGRLVVTVPFGINDHIDHKHTFYLLEPLRLLAKHFDVAEITVLGKWLGIIAQRREADAPRASVVPPEDQLEQLETGFFAVERSLVDEVASLRSTLDEANTKYRSASEELARLKREAAHHESERKSAERAKNELAQQLNEQPQAERTQSKETTELRGELTTLRDQLHAREVTAARLEERLVHAGQIRELELRTRDGEIAQLTQDHQALQAARVALDARLAAAEEALERQTHTHQQELERRQHELDGMEQQLAEQRLALERWPQDFEALEARLNGLIREQAASFESLRNKELEAKLLQGRLQEQLADGAGKQEQIRRLQSELAAINAKLAEFEAKASEHDAQRGEESALQCQALERELTAQREASDELKRKADGLRLQLTSAVIAERTAARSLEEERRNRAAAERKLIQTRNTLSFQLGYELIHGFKSKERFLTLPRALWALQKEAERRRGERGNGTSRATGSHQPVYDGERVPKASSIGAGSATSVAAMPWATAPASSLQVEARPAAKLVRTAAAPAPTAPLRPIAPPDIAAGLSQLRVACIHDEFTFSAFAPECTLLPLSPDKFGAELEAFSPQLLFVESAWRGKDDAWGKRISHRGHELVEVVDWCRARGVPTVFWNKEDPVHFGTFVNTAKLFDFVFTTDLDCIQRYKQALGHNRVFLLPFACQPAFHNPIEKYERKDAICFAGAYYARYTERQQDLRSFMLSFTDTPRLEIYDRNYGKDDPQYAFPPEYEQFIVGTLPFDQIDRAYKGYRYALNLNSIKESQTMFARRVCELLGSNTITVSNFSRAVRLLFGDLVVATDNGVRARRLLQRFAQDESRSRRFRLAGLRKVLREHTYGDRLRSVASKVWGKNAHDGLPRVSVIAWAGSAEQVADILGSFERQTFPYKQLTLVTPPGVSLGGVSPGSSVRHLTRDAAGNLRIADVLAGATHVAALCAQDYYGENYLLDLALGTRYSSAVALGKVAHYARNARAQLTLESDGSQYRSSAAVLARAALIRSAAVQVHLLVDWLDGLEERVFRADDCMAIDEFNYCKSGSGLASEQLAQVRDLTDLDEGVSLEWLEQALPVQSVSAPNTTQQRRIPAERLATIFRAPHGKAISLLLEDGSLVVQSALPDETHEYIYASEAWKPEQLGLPGSNKFRLEVTPGLNVQLVFVFLDAAKQRLGHKMLPASRNETVTPPERTAYIKLGIRIYGSGTTKISALLLDHVAELPERIFGRSRYLLLTNHYPADHDLYRNAFVHRRVADYLSQGTRVDVFRHRPHERLGFHEFEGVDVLTGGSDALVTLLRSNDYEAVLVHFLDPAMWRVLREESRAQRHLVWLHGAEVQAWHRRIFNYSSDAERAEAEIKSNKRDAFWRGVLEQLPRGGRLIFVSRHFAEQTLTDLGLAKDHHACTVIHNLVDGRLFEYHPKSVEQRKRVLSIRPYVSRKYGNDLAVAAILALADKPYFHELFFHLVGDGPLFEETVAPLRGLSNVRLDKGFLTQEEIAHLHRSYGVFLCPTRDDTQGVSRDEAMASGLVPITNRVGAIPEFVDEDCALIAEPESVSGLAEAVTRLYERPALFATLSEQAAQRVRRQSGPSQTTRRELELILDRVSPVPDPNP
jgi:glycosyltransferase involved in cell wall biosynthesis/spore maturation protein CgeB/SAM-dependent methyltransferase